MASRARRSIEALGDSRESVVTDRVFFVVNLWISGDDVASFEAFEHAAADIMSKHGGCMETAVRCSGANGAPFEVHVVSFPSVAAFEEYRGDPRLSELRSLRERVIARTEIWRGIQKRTYGTVGDTESLDKFTSSALIEGDRT
jgi:uncharacterized protein (DUF1330 family)